MSRFWLLLLLVGLMIGCGPAEIVETNTQTEMVADVDDDHEDDDHDDEDHEDEDHEDEDHEDEDHDDEDHDDSERRENDAHEHGAAEMNIAWSGSELAIELLTPAFNVLGFEYAPASESELALADESVATLEEAAFLQFSSSAECELVSAEVHTAFSEEAHEGEGHEDEDEGHEDEDEGHEDEDEDHEDEDEDHEGEEHDDEEGETHSDIDVEYTFNCAQPDQLTELDLSGLFEAFPNFEDLRVQWVSDTQQSAATVSAENAQLSLE